MTTLYLLLTLLSLLLTAPVALLSGLQIIDWIEKRRRSKPTHDIVIRRIKNDVCQDLCQAAKRLE